MHVPVLLYEIIEYLRLSPGDIVFDGTLGGGGHAQEIVRRISPGGRLIGMDKDPEAVERVKERFSGCSDNVLVVNGDYRNIDSVLESEGIREIDGAIFDFGVSSFQIDEADRGFSFNKDGPLDMRFDPERGISAGDIINRSGKEDLAEIIKEYGEERHSKLLSSAICKARKKKKIETTGELVEIIKTAIGSKYYRQKLHPAARTFQALRIYVNDELESVEEGLVKAIRYLKPESRLCAISFHSLEDRIVKNVFRKKASDGLVKILTKKPVTPGDEELRGNIRSRSAKLRVAEKI